MKWMTLACYTSVVIVTPLHRKWPFYIHHVYHRDILLLTQIPQTSTNPIKGCINHPGGFKRSTSKRFSIWVKGNAWHSLRGNSSIYNLHSQRKACSTNYCTHLTQKLPESKLCETTNYLQCHSVFLQDWSTVMTHLLYLHSLQLSQKCTNRKTPCPQSQSV